MKLKSLFAVAALAAGSSAVHAQDLNITVTNLTQAIYFTPLITAAHTADNQMFSTGSAASAQLQAMAEGGDISGLSTLLTGVNADVNENPAGGLLAPAMSTSFMLTNSENNDYLSLTAMILPSNDGFVGLDSWMIPEEAGTYTIYLNAYDAGTEANNELVVEGSGAPGVAGIPAAPGGDAGTGGTGVTSSEGNTMVHIHRGNLGDDNLSGGSSDLTNNVHRWLNPVAKITVVVM
ncbi:spondin domain-containing protein [Thalassomonas actiniarum]|uniref:Spondin domain-containing protein n=1 Tax=Thalassomonas actiniarum TaxID=485447 RepID=A0AAE9YPQ6_9GAMM|nr:spondin domain-containing protein [Thalassomonas actiniarum]WDD98502.1 spondin domain-containing protein [Thalassomonas actiniarum]